MSSRSFILIPDLELRCLSPDHLDSVCTFSPPLSKKMFFPTFQKIVDLKKACNFWEIKNIYGIINIHVHFLTWNVEKNTSHAAGECGRKRMGLCGSKFKMTKIVIWWNSFMISNQERSSLIVWSTKNKLYVIPYSLWFGSRKLCCRKFRRWQFHRATVSPPIVLPSDSFSAVFWYQGILKQT